MDHATVLLTRHLHDLGPSLEDALDPDGSAVAESMAPLAASLSAAVTSSRGLQLTLSWLGYPVVLTACPSPTPDGPRGHDTRPDQVVTSLRLPLELIDPQFEVGSQLVFYAGTSGAFVDLAADLTYALTSRASADGGDAAATGQRAAITLDTDLPPPRPTSGVSGVAELSTINHAIGVLIERGHHLDDVQHTLRRHAGAAGLTPYAFAVGLLQDEVRSRNC